MLLYKVVKFLIFKLEKKIDLWDVVAADVVPERAEYLRDVIIMVPAAHQTDVIS